MQCYEIELKASVSAQALLQHTLERIVTSIEESLVKFCEKQSLKHIDCVIEGIWGYDGNTEYAYYWNEINHDNPFDTLSLKGLITTILIPIRIVSGDQTIWINPCHNSYRTWRPIHIQYKVATDETFEKEQVNIEQQIRDLVPINVVSNGVTITATTSITKYNADANHSSTDDFKCLICNLNASEFNHLGLAYSKSCKMDLKYSITPDTAYVRVLEFLLDIGYKNQPATRHLKIVKNSAEAAMIDERKTSIKNKLKEILNLEVDKVKRRGQGILNDSSTARTALSATNKHIFADILAVDHWLLDGFYAILVAIDSGYFNNSKTFGNFCKAFAYKYTENYNWHLISKTIHLILVHFEQIISHSLPLGSLTYEAATFGRNEFWEPCTPDYASAEQRNIKLTKLQKTMFELSDPVISNISLDGKKPKKKPLPVSVFKVFKLFSVPASGSGFRADAADSDDDDDDEDGHGDERRPLVLKREETV